MHNSTLIDAIRYLDTVNDSSPLKERSVADLVKRIEKYAGIVAVYDAQQLPFGRRDMEVQLRLAETLRATGVISSYYPRPRLPDEPPFSYWGTSTVGREQPSGGAAVDSDESALTAALAEALERHIWRETDDYFSHTRIASVNRLIAERRAHISPFRFVSYSEDQRRADPHRNFDMDTKFLWLEAKSMVTGARVLMPAQTVSGYKRLHAGDDSVGAEPLIRSRHTVGLATWPTKRGAQLAGALECIEREAFIILWFNQLVLPRLDLSTFRTGDNGLARLLSRCERYRLLVHAVPMLTDAPTHATCVVVEDISGAIPRFSIGLKAHRNIEIAIEKAILEALRQRRFARITDDAIDRPGIFGQTERLRYWAGEEQAAKLAFLISGPLIPYESQPWETDSTDEHLDRIIEWCRKETLECLSTSLTHSKMNPTPWNIEMVALPDLQQFHLREDQIALGGNRWKSVPERFGFTSRAAIYTQEPHPYV